MKKTVVLLIGTVLLCIFAVSLLFVYISTKKSPVTEYQISINEGDTYDLNISDIFLASECNWRSEDNQVASVDTKGTITGEKEGSTQVICTVKDKKKNFTFLFDVTVSAVKQ